MKKIESDGSDYGFDTVPAAPVTRTRTGSFPIFDRDQSNCKKIESVWKIGEWSSEVVAIERKKGRDEVRLFIGPKPSCQVGVVPMEMCEGFLIKIIC